MAIYQPLSADALDLRQSIGPIALGCVRLAFIRADSATLCSQFGQRLAAVGDAVLVRSNTLCSAESGAAAWLRPSSSTPII